jgi:hypothetical protein
VDKRLGMTMEAVVCDQPVGMTGPRYTNERTASTNLRDGVYSIPSYGRHMNNL